jgi:hypothetical protein
LSDAQWHAPTFWRSSITSRTTTLMPSGASRSKSRPDRATPGSPEALSPRPRAERRRKARPSQLHRDLHRNSGLDPCSPRPARRPPLAAGPSLTTPRKHNPVAKTIRAAAIPKSEPHKSCRLARPCMRRHLHACSATHRRFPPDRPAMHRQNGAIRQPRASRETPNAMQVPLCVSVPLW